MSRVKSPSAYTGVAASNPPEIIYVDKAPTTKDRHYIIGTIWISKKLKKSWMLVNLDEKKATWASFLAEEGLEKITTDSGVAEQSSRNINLLGDGILETSASGDSVTIALSNSGSNGQVLIGGGSQPQWADITSTGGTVSITHPTDNSINLEAAGGGGTLTGLDGDTGTASPVAGIITIAGGTNINTVGTTGTLTVNLDNNVTLSGDLTVSSLTNGVIQTDDSGLFSATNGSNGQVLIGGGTEPQWQNITSSDGSVTINEGPNSIDLSTSSLASDWFGDNGFIAYTSNDVNVVAGKHYFGEGSLALEVFYNNGEFFKGDSTTPAYYTAPADGFYFFSYIVSYKGTVSCSVVIETTDDSVHYGQPTNAKGRLFQGNAFMPLSSGAKVYFIFTTSGSNQIYKGFVVPTQPFRTVFSGCRIA